jgi:hypothetical protein
MSGLVSAIGVTTDFISKVSDPTASAPPWLKAKAVLVLDVIKWASLIGVLGLLVASSMIVLAGNRGYGGGMSPELKSRMINAVTALVIVGFAAQIVHSLS